MNKPFKIIFKYKNSNGSVQYNPYIFIGNVEPSINTILYKFTKLPFIITLKTLSKSNINYLEQYYGKMWYKYFFIYNHLEHSINTISSSDKKILQSKLGKEWVSTHLNKGHLQFGGDAEIDDDSVNNEYEDDSVNNGDEDDSVNNGDEDDSVNNGDEDDSENNIQENKAILDENMDDGELYAEEEQEHNEELDAEGNVKEIKQKQKQNTLINSLIKKANIKDKKAITNINTFDVSKNDNFKSETLENVYNKIYIKLYYIYDDDDILMIKRKFCASVMNDKVINKDSFLLPSRQYMYSQYIENSKLKTHMIGHRFLKKENLFDIINAIPETNLDYYYNKNKRTEQIKDYMSLNLVKLEDNNDIILNDLNDYTKNYEIFMLDIYHELYELKDYNEITEDQLQNLYDTYIKIYFPSIKKQDILQIINYINNKNSTEFDIIKVNYNKIKLELYTHMKPFEIFSNTLHNYDTFKYFKKLYITLAIIKVNIQTELIDLYLIFENFITSKQIPFIRYHTKNNKNFVKFYTKVTKEEKDYFLKWFENTPVGISIKIYLEKYKKYVTLKIYDTGRIEYTTQWKEDENITIQDIESTYGYIISILKNINKTSERIKIKIPKESDFKIEFVNAIQTFVVPSTKSINYSTFQTFSKYFFPIISYVSQSDTDSTKHGAHMIYKRLSKYQQIVNKRIENNIADILRNYEYTPENLITYIVSQLNITRDEAIKEIENVKSKYRFYKKKGTKKGKRMDQLPKYKQPGISVTIQGTHTENQIIRISGCKSKYLLDKIIIFMSVFIFLFIEIILLNKYSNIKNQLEIISKIAIKLDDVIVIKESVNTRSNIKRLVDLDKERFGFTPKTGKSNYSRMCLKEYQPLGFTSKNLDKLRALGYRYDEKEKTYVYKSKTKKKRHNQFITKDVVLKAVKLKNKTTGEDIYYVCHPKVNKNNYQFISFQDLSKHPQKMCMPCCNKQNQLESNKPNIINRYLQCNSQVTNKDDYISTENILYISKDTNKLTSNRYGLLPIQLDVFLNNLTSRKMILKNIHFLEETLPSYFLKYGIQQTSNSLLDSVSICLNTTTKNIINDITSILKKDKNEQLFISLYSGRIKTLFNTAENYIKYIQTFEQIDYKYLVDILCYIYKINLFIFNRKYMNIEIDDETIKRIDEMVLDCHLDYNISDYYDKKRKNIIILQENNYFNPIFEIIKKINSKNIDTKFVFKYDETNIINHILEYYNISCVNKINASDIQNKFINISTNIYNELISLKDKQYRPILQMIDNNYKCISFILHNKFILNVIPSKSIELIPNILVNNKSKYVKSFKNTYQFLLNLSKIINLKFNYKPLSALYSNVKGNKYYIKYIKCHNNIIIDILPEYINDKVLKKMNIYPTFFYTTNEMVDKEILQGKNNILFDERLYNIKKNEYNQESYELLRLHFSNFLEKTPRIKNTINNIITNNESFNQQHNNLYKIIKNILNGTYTIATKPPPIKVLESYKTTNKRFLCHNQKEDDCTNNLHCSYSKGKCSFILHQDKMNLFINKLIDELINNPLKQSELLQLDDYYVSNIVNREIFTERDKQQIIREDVISFEKSLYNIFGKNAAPIIGKKINKMNLLDETYIELNEQNKLKFYKTFFIQNIKVNDNTLLRAYANGFFWIKNTYENIKYRNFGYYHPVQTELANYLRSIVVDNLLKFTKIPEKNKILHSFVDNIVKYSYNLYKYPKLYTIAIPELLALQMQYNDIPIYIYDYNYQILYILDNVNIVYDSTKNNKVISKYNTDKFKEKSIHFKFTLLPDSKFKIINIEVMYFISEKKIKS